MKNITIVTAVALTALFASPAMADDMAVDVDALMEAAEPQSYNAIDLPIGNFDLSAVSGTSGPGFMATMAEHYAPGYRIGQKYGTLSVSEKTDSDQNIGLASFILPAEYAYRSRKQDSGVHALTPGQFISSAVRSDFISETGPSADKASLGVVFGF